MFSVIVLEGVANWSGSIYQSNLVRCGSLSMSWSSSVRLEDIETLPAYDVVRPRVVRS